MSIFKIKVSDGGWQDVGEVLIFSLPALAWKLVNNRKNLNFSRDDEMEMSTEHTILLFFSRYLTGCKFSNIIIIIYIYYNIYFFSWQVDSNRNAPCSLSTLLWDLLFCSLCRCFNCYSGQLITAESEEETLFGRME